METVGQEGMGQTPRGYLINLYALFHWLPNRGSGLICESQTHFYRSLNFLSPSFCFECLSVSLYLFIVSARLKGMAETRSSPPSGVQS